MWNDYLLLDLLAAPAYALKKDGQAQPKSLQ